jgi:hypothetical protein
MGEESGRTEQRELPIEMYEYVQAMEQVATVGAHVINTFWQALDAEIPDETAGRLLEMFFYNYMTEEARE